MPYSCFLVPLRTHISAIFERILGGVESKLNDNLELFDSSNKENYVSL